MHTHFPNADGSVTVRSDGYGPYFVTQLATHLTHLTDALAPGTGPLDLTPESLQRLDERFKKYKQESRPFPPALLAGTVAYCGEVLRVQFGGEWRLWTFPADAYGGERYFPFLHRAAGNAIDFVGLVEEEVARSQDSCLYSALRVLMLPALTVGNWEAHPCGDDTFPALADAP